MTLSIDAIRDARTRIRGQVNRTPIMTSGTLDTLAGAQLFFKCENLQKVGAFKARGAANAVSSLADEEARRGVVTHSSGNHGAALAWAAKLRGVPAYIVMPKNAPMAKQEAVRRYGGKIFFCEPTLQARDDVARVVAERTGAVFVHPYDDFRVMAGQGTIGLELLEEVPKLDIVLCPVGGGGQLSGIAVAIKATRTTTRVIGVEPAGADDAARSLKLGYRVPSVSPCTIADGLLTSLSEKTFSEIKSHVHGIVTVSETAIAQAMRTIWEVMKIVVEPSGAVAYAAVQGELIDVQKKRVGVVLSGGNLDLDRLPWQT